MKRGITDTLNDDLVSRVKKQKIAKTLDELWNEVANGQFDDFRQWLQEANTIILSLDSKDTLLINNLSNLGKALQDTTVTAINLACNAIGPQGAKDLAIGLKDSNVTALYLFSNNLGPQGAKDLAKGLNGTKVTTVDLMSNNLGPKGAKDFAKNLKGTNVTEINLAHNRIGPQGAKDLAKALNGTKVTTVNLMSNNLGPKGAKDFAENLKGTNVTTIILWDNKITAKSAKDIAISLTDTEVTTLNLGGNLIGDQGTIDFIKGLKNTKVTTACLSYNKISDQTATTISTYIPSTYLLKVDLGFQNQALSEALRLNNQKLVLAPYYLACLNYLLEDEKLKYKDLPKLDQRSTSEDALKFAGGIFMHLSFSLRKQVLNHFPLMDQKSRANTYLNLATKRRGKIQIEDQNKQDNSEDANPSRSSSWGCVIG